MTLSDYFENLAIRHMEVNHVPGKKIHFLSSEDEKYTAQVDELRYPAVIFDDGAGYEFGGQPGAYFIEREPMLFFLQHVGDASSAKEINKAINTCEQIMKEFLNQMLEDKKDPLYRFLKPFRLEDVKVDIVKNIDHAQYGVIALLGMATTYKAVNCRNPFKKI